MTFFSKAQGTPTTTKMLQEETRFQNYVFILSTIALPKRWQTRIDLTRSDGQKLQASARKH